MSYLFCGVVEFRGMQDQLGTACGRSAKTLCYDCGTSLGSGHIKPCELCVKTFCPSCPSFHQSEHAKPAQSDQTTEFPKKKRA